MGKILHDYTGQKFGRLTALRMATRKVDEKGWLLPAEWICECECGRNVVVRAQFLKTGHTKSCGCLTKENVFRAAQGKAEKKEVLEEERQWGPCPYPFGGCQLNKNGWCCDDCDKERCSRRCDNLPEKCGCKRLKENEQQ